MIDNGEMVLDDDINIGTHSYVQHGNILYFENHVSTASQHRLYSMDLSSTSTTIKRITNQEIPYSACFVSASLEHDYLFIIGGTLSSNDYTRSGMNVYDITDGTWILIQAQPYMYTPSKTGQITV